MTTVSASVAFSIAIAKTPVSTQHFHVAQEVVVLLSMISVTCMHERSLKSGSIDSKSQHFNLVGIVCKCFDNVQSLAALY